jgi:hypothetical protein
MEPYLSFVHRYQPDLGVSHFILDMSMTSLDRAFVNTFAQTCEMKIMSGHAAVLKYVHQ